jgi:hypothetical protein
MPCWCEYDDENGGTRHMMQCLCGCDELDTALEDTVTCKECLCTNPRCRRVLETVEDRIRIPWPGGAKKIVVSPFFILVAVFLVASTWMVVALPLIVALYVMVVVSSIRASRARKVQFYVGWLVWSVVLLGATYVMWVRPTVPPRVALAFDVSVAAMALCFYATRRDAAVARNRRVDPIEALAREHVRRLREAEAGISKAVVGGGGLVVPLVVVVVVVVVVVWAAAMTMTMAVEVGVGAVQIAAMQAAWASGRGAAA